MSRLEGANYKFVQNQQCEYFPCHEGIKDEDFNCLFCYCPLYFVADCGGRYTMVSNKNSTRMVKSCVNCTRPHERDGYDVIVARLSKELGGAVHG